MHDVIHVAVSGAGSLFGQGIIKCLRVSGLNAMLHGLDYFETAVGFAWCDTRHLLPDILSPDVGEDFWFDALCDILVDKKVQVLFVGVDFEILPLSRRAVELEARTGCTVVVSDPDLVEACKDKLATSDLLRRHGLPAPDTVLATTDPPAIERRLGYPLILKPRFGARSRGVAIIQDRADLEAARVNPQFPGMIAQQYLPGDDNEYSCGVVCLDGVLDSVAVLRRRLKDGNTAIAYSEGDAGLRDFCGRVASLLQPFGPLNLQFRVVDGRPYIFEINPRFSGTTIFRCRLGINEPARILRHLLGLPNLPKPELRRGRVMRYFEEMVDFLDV